MKQRDPQVLWRQFGAGDHAAFADLYERHQQDVYRYCRSLLHHDDDARDAAHSTWAAVWTTPDAARRDVPMRPWLFRIAHNQSIDLLRRRRPDQELAAAHEIAAPDDLAADLDLRERLATLRADLLSLSERQRSALLLREMAGLSHQEIASTLGISAGAAKQTIYEARQALADAEGGRSMACDGVQRAVSAGDRRVRRGRGLRAHLRGCAACRTFAAAVDEQGRDLRILVPALPAPATAALLTQLGGGAASGGGAGMASGGLSAVGAKLGGSVAAKVAVAAAVAAVGTGGEQLVVPKAGGDRAVRARTASVASAPPTIAVAARRPVSSSTVVSVRRRRSPATTANVVTARTVTSPEHSPLARHRADPPAAPAAAPTAPAPAAAMAAPGAQHDEPATAPGHDKSEANQGKAQGKAAAPGQTKDKDKADDNDKDKDKTPPGHTDAAASAPVDQPAPAIKLPPGQAKKSDPTPPQDDAEQSAAEQAGGAAKAEPPGQKKK